VAAPGTTRPGIAAQRTGTGTSLTIATTT